MLNVLNIISFGAIIIKNDGSLLLKVEVTRIFL